MKKSNRFLAFLIPALALTACANDAGGDKVNTDTSNTTQNNPATTQDNKGVILSDETTRFVTEAASGGMMEVELGKMAQQNGTDPRLKAFGAMMVRDHTTANDELKTIAATKNIVLPDSMSAEHKEHVETMRKMKGKEFDQHYIDMMQEDHEDDVSKFEKATNNVTDPEIKAFAVKNLPILRSHLDSAKNMKSGTKQ